MFSEAIGILCINHIQQSLNTTYDVHGVRLPAPADYGNASGSTRLVQLDVAGYVPEAGIRPSTAAERGAVRLLDTPISATNPQVPAIITGNTISGNRVPLSTVKGPVLSRDASAPNGLRMLNLDTSNMADVVFVTVGNGVGNLESYNLKDGATTVKTVSFTYNVDGTINTVTEVTGGITLVSTFAYDVNGEVTGITRV